MVRKLLATREDVFPDYTLDGFRAAFGEPVRDRGGGARSTGYSPGAVPDDAAGDMRKRRWPHRSPAQSLSTYQVRVRSTP